MQLYSSLCLGTSDHAYAHACLDGFILEILVILFWNLQPVDILIIMFWNLQPVDKQSLLDSGIFCCLVHILNALLNPEESSQTQSEFRLEELISSEKSNDGDTLQVGRLEVFSLVWYTLILIICAVCGLFCQWEFLEAFSHDLYNLGRNEKSKLQLDIICNHSTFVVLNLLFGHEISVKLFP